MASNSVFRDVLGAFCCCFPTRPRATSPFKRNLCRVSDWRAHPILRDYELGAHIADGGFSEIFLAKHRPTGVQYCLKVVYLRKPGLQAHDAKVLESEAKWLMMMEHPNLLRCKAAFESKYHLVMVLEYLSGGEMLQHIHSIKQYSEAEAAKLFAQVVSAVQYLHNLSIMHRDIKPENVIFARSVDECQRRGKALRVKLIDLGMAAVYNPRKPVYGCTGSPGFIDPSVVKGGPHTPAGDMYSLGVLLFIMLTGGKPFNLRDAKSFAYARQSIKDAPGLQDARFKSLTPAARQLLLSLLADEPSARPTAAQVLHHPFLTQQTAAQLRPLDGIIRRRITQLAALRRFRGLSFALLSSKAQGQDLSEFMGQVAARRKSVHRDLVSRAKLREEFQRYNLPLPALGAPPQLQQHAAAGGVAAAGSKLAPHAPPKPSSLGASARVGAPAGAPGGACHAYPLVSIESGGSQEPLLVDHREQLHSHLPTAAATTEHGPISGESANSDQPLLAGCGRLASHSHAPLPNGVGAASKPPPMNKTATMPRRCPPRAPELELAALSPLALLSELPAFARAHSAPESFSAGLLPRYSLQRHHDGGAAAAAAAHGAGGTAHGGEPLPRLSSGGSRDTASWLEKVAAGADTRAFSASPWTLNFLENEELLQALTGVEMHSRLSSSGLESALGGKLEGWLSDGTLHGAASQALAALAIEASHHRRTAAAGGGGGGGGTAPLAWQPPSGAGAGSRHGSNAAVVATASPAEASLLFDVSVHSADRSAGRRSLSSLVPERRMSGAGVAWSSRRHVAGFGRNSRSASVNLATLVLLASAAASRRVSFGQRPSASQAAPSSGCSTDSTAHGAIAAETALQVPGKASAAGWQASSLGGLPFPLQSSEGSHRGLPLTRLSSGSAEDGSLELTQHHGHQLAGSSTQHSAWLLATPPRPLPAVSLSPEGGRLAPPAGGAQLRPSFLDLGDAQPQFAGRTAPRTSGSGRGSVNAHRQSLGSINGALSGSLSLADVQSQMAGSDAALEPSGWASAAASIQDVHRTMAALGLSGGGLDPSPASLIRADCGRTSLEVTGDGEPLWRVKLTHGSPMGPWGPDALLAPARTSLERISEAATPSESRAMSTCGNAGPAAAAAAAANAAADVASKLKEAGVKAAKELWDIEANARAPLPPLVTHVGASSGSGANGGSDSSTDVQPEAAQGGSGSGVGGTDVCRKAHAPAPAGTAERKSHHRRVGSPAVPASLWLEQPDTGRTPSSRHNLHSPFEGAEPFT